LGNESDLFSNRFPHTFGQLAADYNASRLHSPTPNWPFGLASLRKYKNAIFISLPQNNDAAESKLFGSVCVVFLFSTVTCDS
jgi:hypothetical protein